MRDVKKELLSIAQEKVNKKMAEEQERREKQIKNEIKDFEFILELIEKRLIYKKTGDSWRNPKYVMITREIFFEDYSNCKDEWKKGIQIEEWDSWKDSNTLRIKVNGIYYEHIGKLIQDYEKELKDKTDRVTRLQSILRELEECFNSLKSQEKNIMEFIKNYNEIEENL